MIPAFNDSGFLPPGLHFATLAEVAARFGSGSDARREQMESIVWMVELAVRAAVKRIVLNGSFVSDIIEPNDVDCVLLAADVEVDAEADEELNKGLPYMEIALVGPDEFEELVAETFATDRYGVPKGMIEVVEWH